MPALVCLIYGLSKGALSNLLMIRMYMLLTLMTLILAYLVARFIEQKYTGFYPALFAVIYAGMFTQYFYVVFAFFFCAIFVIYLLLQREIKEFLVSSLFAIAGVGTTLLTFPYVGQQLTSQTTVSLNTVAENAKAGWGVYVERVLNFTYQMITNMPIVAIIAVLSFAGIIVMVMIDRKKLKKMFENSHNFWLIVIASILSFIMIAIIAPYAAIRYVYHLMPLFALIVMVIAQNVSVILRDSMKRKVCWMMAVIGSFLFMSLFEPNYLYTEYAEIDAILAEHANELCVYISSNNNPSITSDIGHLILFDDICIIDEELFALDDYVEKKLSDSMVVFISQYPNARDDQGILEDLKKRYDFSDISKIASENFSNIYIIEK